MIRILVADDREDLRSAIERSLKRLQYEVKTAADGEEALKLSNEEHFDLAILDVKMPGRDGLEVLKELREKNPNTRVILMTAYASLETAVEALRAEAVDYLLKPFSLQELESRVRKVLDKYHFFPSKIIAPEEDLDSPLTPSVGFIGESASIKKIMSLIQKVAPSSSPILILGESGTGKEVLSQEIHRLSNRKGRPFIAINCMALAEGVMESELFGHEKGAFTGALVQKPGLLEIAHGGTLLLDEIGELSPAIQVKLLRFLQEHEFQRVGGTKTIQVDVRIIAATNRNLFEEVATKRFREDLFYRLNVFEVILPPLRERIEDLPLLVDFFLARYQKALHKKAEMTTEAMAVLHQYSWPGNVRELENVIERAVVLASDGYISPEDFPQRICVKPSAVSGSSSTVPMSAFSMSSPMPSAPMPSSAGGSQREMLESIEKEMIRKSLEQNHWNTSKAANQLGMKRSTLQYRIQKYSLQQTK